MQSFYVYVYRDPRPSKDLHPIYVGKGTAANRRAYDHWERPSLCINPLLRRCLAKIKAAELEPVIEIVAEFDDEDDAFALEIDLIAQYGRRNLGTGSLCNLTRGGDGAAGQVYTPERRAAAKARMKTPEAMAESRRRMLAAWNDPIQREQRTAAIRVAQACPEYRKRLREAIKASRTEEVRAQISEASIRHWQCDEYRRKISESKGITMATPEEKERKSAASKETWRKNGDKMRAAIKESKSSPEHRAAVGKRTKAYYEGNEEARRLSGEYAKAYNTPEVRAEKARIMKERWADPEYRARMMAKRADKRNPSEPLNP